MSYGIVDDATGMPSYFSLKAGEELGMRAGAWIGDPQQALRFVSRKDATLFSATYLAVVPHARVVEIDV